MRYLLIALAIFANGLYAQNEFKQGDIAYIKVPQENMRISPNGTVISSIPQGTKLNVLGQQGNWVAVQLVAWIWAPSLTKDIDKVEGYSMQALHILVKTEAEANEIKKLLDAGTKDFSELAKEKSIGPNAQKGGNLGIIHKGDLLPELDEALRKLKPGQISGVLKSEIGYHILKRLK